MIPAKDISRYQGAWQDTGETIVMIKMSGGDDGLYMDSNAAANYSGATAAGKAVGGYHFAGWTNPTAEASYFLRAMSPVAENDVFALDAEAIPSGVDPVAWSQTFVTYIHDQLGIWPLVYMNLSTLNSYNWDPVLANCGLWLADWAVSPEANIPTSHAYVMQQYSDGPNYDHDEWFGTLDQFKAYGYHAAVTPPVTPVEPPVVAPDPPVVVPPVDPPTTEPVDPTPPVVDPPVTPEPPVVTPPVVEPPTEDNWYTSILNWLKKLWKEIVG